MTGRIVWVDASNWWLHLEAHCVWRTPSGTLIDPTAKVDRETDIIFVAEPLVWDERMIPSRYNVFSDDPIVRELCELAVEWQGVLSRRPPGQEIPLHSMIPEEKDLFRRKAANEMRLAPELMASLMAMNSGETFQRVGRNEPCPCGSGKKDKKCCLRWPEQCMTALTTEKSPHNARLPHTSVAASWDQSDLSSTGTSCAEAFGGRFRGLGHQAAIQCHQ